MWNGGGTVLLEVEVGGGGSEADAVAVQAMVDGMAMPVRPPVSQASIANRHGTAKPRSFSRPARTPPSYGMILLLSLHRIAMLTSSTCKTRGAVTSPGALLSAHRQLEVGGGGIYWPEHAAPQAFSRNQDFAKAPATDYGWM